MSDDLTKFPGSTLDGGINVFTPDFTADLQMDLETFNVSQGIHQGMGPRYGMSPIPGQSDTVAIAAYATHLPGMAGSEQAVSPDGFQMALRKKLYGVAAMKFPSGQLDPTDGYLWIGLYGANKIFVEPSSVNGNGVTPVAGYTTNISDGLYDQKTGFFRDLVLPAAGTGIPVLTNAVNYATFAILQASGPNVPTKWLLGSVTAVGDDTHPPSMNLWSIESGVLSFVSWRTYCGVSTDFYYQSYKPKSRITKLYALTAGGAQNRDFSITFTPTSSIYKANTYFLPASTQVDFSATTATLDVNTGAAALNKLALYNDDDLVTKSSYTAVALAIENKAYLGILQGGAQGAEGDPLQWCDLSNEPLKPVTDNQYQETGQKRATAFRLWPAFVRAHPGRSIRMLGTRGGQYGFAARQYGL